MDNTSLHSLMTKGRRQRTRALVVGSLSVVFFIIVKPADRCYAQFSQLLSVPTNPALTPVELPVGQCVTTPPDATFGATMLARDGNGIIERRVALVIGNSAYRKGLSGSTPRPLPNPARDANSVRRALHALGFTVIGGVDLTKVASLACLSRFYDMAQGAKAALVYFAGHGLSTGGNTYVLPIDAHVDTERSSGRNFLRVNGSNGILQNVRQRAPGFLFLDACRNNPFSGVDSLKEVDGESISVGDGHRGLVPLRDSDGGISGLRDFYYVYATFPGETATDDTGSDGHSPFATAFLRHVADPGVDVPRLLIEMSLDVGAATSGAQLPWGEGAIKPSSDLYFNGTHSLDDLIKQSDQLAVEADSLRAGGQRIQALATALRGLPLGYSPRLSSYFGHAMASLYRAMHSKEVVTENSPSSCASVVALSPDGKAVLTVVRGKRGRDCETDLPDVDPPRLWDTRTGELIRKFDLSGLPSDAEFDRVLGARFSEDGKLIILEVLPGPSPSTRGQSLVTMFDRRREPTFQWWDCRTGKFVRSLPGLSNKSQSVQAFNQDTVVTSCQKAGCSSLDVLSAKDGRRRASLKNILEPVVQVAKDVTDGAGRPVRDEIKTSEVSSDGRLFFAISEHNGIGGIWDLVAGKLKCSIDSTHATIPDRIYFDSGSFRRVQPSFDKVAHRIAFTRDNQTVRVYDIEKCKEVRAITPNARAFLTSIALSPDGRSLFTAQTNYQVRVWSVSTGDVLRTLVGHKDWVRTAAFTNDSKSLATAADDGSVRLWGVDREPTVHTIWPAPGFITEATFNHRANAIVTVSDGLLFPDGVVPSAQVWVGDYVQPKTLAEWRRDKIAAAEFSPNDRWILGTARSDVVPHLTVWDATTLKTVPGVSSPERFSAAAFGPGPSSLAVKRDQKIELWELGRDGAKLANVYPFQDAQPAIRSVARRRATFSSQPEKLAFSKDGTKLVINDGSLVVLTFPRLKTVRKLELPDDAFTDARFDPSGKYILGVSHLGTGLWDISTGKQVRTFMSPDGEQVLAAAISPDGNRVATASWSDGATIRIWSVPTGEIIAKQSADLVAGTGYLSVLNEEGIIEGLEWANWSVSFNREGTRVMSAAGDGAARLWDIGPYGPDLIRAAEDTLLGAGERSLVEGRMVFWDIVPE